MSRASLVLVASLTTALLVFGCARANQAALAPAPTPRPPPAVWAAPGVYVVTAWAQPVFLVEGAYWLWHGGAWRRWVQIGWRAAAPPAVLADLRGHTRFEGGAPAPAALPAGTLDPTPLGAAR